MTKRQVAFLVVAALITLVTIAAARSVMNASAPAPSAKQEQVEAVAEVLVAKKDLPSGRFISAADIEWRKWPAGSSTEGFYLKSASSEKDYIGAVVRSGFRTGEPLAKGRILKAGDRGFISAVLAPGMRAMTVRVTPVSGVAGLIFPNDRVDIILAHQITMEGDIAQTERRVASTVMEDVRIIALDQRTSDQKPTDPKTALKMAELATLEVTPQQAEQLALVSQMGTLSLVLRSLASETQDDESGAITADIKANEVPNENNVGIDPELLQAAKQAIPAPVNEHMREHTGLSGNATWDSDVSRALPPPTPRSSVERKVQIYRGSDVSDVTFEGTRP